MVSSKLKLRNYVPLLALFALILLFFKLPEAPNFFSKKALCKTCISNNPYVPLIGAGYFSLLLAISLLFPKFPSPSGARGGIVWSALLFFGLTGIEYPNFCFSCLTAHGCHLLMWGIWLNEPVTEIQSSLSIKEKFCLLVFVPLSVISLFSTLNLTFLIYHLHQNQNALAHTLKPGDILPSFTAVTYSGKVLTLEDETSTGDLSFNFISPNCSFCKEQLELLNRTKQGRIINVTPHLSEDLVKQYPFGEWIEDKNGKLNQLFKVSGYPTLYVIESQNRVKKVFPGVSE